MQTFAEFTIMQARDKTNDVAEKVRPYLFLAGQIMLSIESTVRTAQAHFMEDHALPRQMVQVATAIALARSFAEAMFVEDGEVEVSVDDEIAHAIKAAIAQYRLHISASAN